MSDVAHLETDFVNAVGELAVRWVLCGGIPVDEEGGASGGIVVAAEDT